MKIALVHDYMVQYGGAERVLEVFTEIFPDAPIYTLVYDEKLTGGVFRGKKIRTSFLQKIPLISSHHRTFPLLMPLAIESFDLSRFDVVLSDSNSYAKGVITGAKTLHLSYCHTPMRYAWDDCHRHLREFDYSKLTKRFAPFGTSYLRLWDKISADRPDQYIANSHFVARRIAKYYRQIAPVVHPPVSTRKFHLASAPGDYFLLVGRALPYKRFDIAIAAFNELGLPLKIVGKGPELKRLQAMAKSNIEFTGFLSDPELAECYARCRALIFPSEEDFGIVPLEAMASGRPVIAYRGGGALETIREGETGMFFAEQTPASIQAAVEAFAAREPEFDPRCIRKHAETFDEQIFKTRIRQLVEDAYQNFITKPQPWN